MDELLPCPFCGKKNSEMLSGEVWFVRCRTDGCDCEGPVRDSEAGAVAAWNCRPDTATITRQAEDARAMHLASVAALTGLIEALTPLVKLDPEGEVGEWAEKIQRRVEEIGKPAPVVLTEEEMDARCRAWMERAERMDRIAALRPDVTLDPMVAEERAAAIAHHERVNAELTRLALTGVR